MARKAPYLISMNAGAFESGGDILAGGFVHLWKRDRNGNLELLDCALSPSKFAADNASRKNNPREYLFAFELAELMWDEAKKVMKALRAVGLKVEGPESDGDMSAIRAMIECALGDLSYNPKIMDWNA